jgi:LPS-assembly protein
VTITLDEYALLRHAVFRVKGVPLLYLPAIYYPVQEDDRATGFLMPIYGSGNLQGHSIKNAFFWAINRSHDATFYHDWFSKAGQGFGGEYRYALAPHSHGTGSVYVIDERDVLEAQAAGGIPAIPAKRSYEVRGSVAQRLPAGLSARGDSNWFSSVTTMQWYRQDFNRASDPTRRIGGNVSGHWGAYTLSVTADRKDRFFDETTMVTTGALPRVAFSLGERPIGRLPLYAGVGSEYAGIQQRRSRDGIVDPADDLGLTRMEVSPSLRMPLSRWPFLSINTSVAWRGIWWSESLVPQAVDGEPLDGTRTQAAEPIGRSYFDLQARITGPVFHRIFDTPNRAYAQRFKHVIEPSLVIRGTTDIEGQERIVRLQSEDFVLGNGTQFQYALTNRLYAKRERAREILMATLFQTYYTDETAVDEDPQYRSSFSGLRPASFSAVALHVRARPSDRISADVRTEWDHHVRAIGTLAASGTIQTAWLQATAGWSQRRHIPDLPGFEFDRATNSLNASTHVRSTLNRVGGMYEFTLDLQQATVQNQRIVAYYNAQCCGVVAEYQVRGRPGVAAGAPQDRRFNVSFSLAGIGTFSNLLEALGGAPQAR